MSQIQNPVGDIEHRPITGIILVNGEQCFIDIAGIPLWQRQLLTGHKAGIRHWLILAWHDTATLRKAITCDRRLQAVTCEVYNVADCSPTRLATQLPTEDVLIMACNAVFDHHALLEWQGRQGNLLGVTSTHPSVPVVLENDRVIAVSPESTATYGCGSAGLLSCSGTHLRRLLQQSWQSLQQASSPFVILLSHLLDTSVVQTIDLSKRLWQPIVPPFTTHVTAAETALFQQLGRQGDSFIVRQVNRRISQALSKRLLHTAISPNQITLCSALIGISGALLLAQPFYLAQVFGSLLFLCSTIIDGCDGEVARLTFQESDFGGKLDVMMDNVVHLFLFPGIALGVYRETHDISALVLGGLTMGGVLVSMAAYLPSLWRRSANRRPPPRMHESLASRDFSYLLLLLALIGKLAWFLWATAVGTYLFAGALFIVSRLRQRQT